MQVIHETLHWKKSCAGKKKRTRQFYPLDKVIRPLLVQPGPRVYRFNVRESVVQRASYTIQGVVGISGERFNRLSHTKTHKEKQTARLVHRTSQVVKRTPKKRQITKSIHSFISLLNTCETWERPVDRESGCTRLLFQQHGEFDCDT